MEAPIAPVSAASLLNMETLRILKRGEHNLGIPCIAAVACDLLDEGALSGNQPLTKGRSVLYFSEVSKQFSLSMRLAEQRRKAPRSQPSAPLGRRPCQ